MSVSPGYFGLQGFIYPFVVCPAASDVRTATQYGALGVEFTGTLDVGGGGGTVPSAFDVRLGVAVGFGAGTLVLPAAGDVESGIGYGAAGSEFAGTLALPSVGDVRNGTAFGAGGTEFTGTLVIPPGSGDPWAILEPGSYAAGTFGYLLAQLLPAQIADKVLGRNLAGGSDGGRTVAEALAAARNKVAFDVPSVGQFTVYGTDDVTPLWVGSYSRGANTLGPLTGVDPS